MQTDDPALSCTAPALNAMRTSLSNGEIAGNVQFLPGLSLMADPALKIGGQFCSPAGRLLELDITTSGVGGWIALHVKLGIATLSETAYLGFACRHAAPAELMIRACLRSGTEDGFVDTFFDKHILAAPDPLNHVDALHIATCRTLPETAPWRELILFLPKRDFRWHLHDLRPFAL